ncbi:phosphotransferase enzyme family protein [Tichowtungia aerotolerans]|uniref:Phosphotransferase n=1 Tax=Tichowtungia aerotolerans TaxID=2697043 RepID=A0A6P1MDD4_9BACT|nr:aminoglycoside phosphotransferase family protein [Tichowtungia aerotolerans]QHI69115.1 phosphotransferase [Tichowtungia aerotolerans]
MKPAQIAEQFNVAGRLASIRPTGSGNVNDTYLAVFRTHFSEERIIIQRVNGHVFAHPEWIMENMSILTNHCHKQLKAESETADRIWQLPRIVPCRSGQDYFRDENGECWRALTLIASATSFDVAQSAEHAQEVGTVLGQFHRLLSTMNPLSLRDTLPGFHETPKYLEKYDAVLETESARELSESSMEVRNLIRFVEDRREFAYVLQNAQDAGELHIRLIHGDPKVSNIMIDDDTFKGTSIIDLDTAKPGLIHYDFGDALRSLCNRQGEETKDVGKVSFDLILCEAFVRGYMVHAGSFLTDNDKKYLYDSIRLITFELGLRFFQDYLAGNVYFKVKSPEQNLHRAKIQFKLCESIETRKRQINELLEQVFTS